MDVNYDDFVFILVVIGLIVFYGRLVLFGVFRIVVFYVFFEIGMIFVECCVSYS